MISKEACVFLAKAKTNLSMTLDTQEHMIEELRYSMFFLGTCSTFSQRLEGGLIMTYETCLPLYISHFGPKQTLKGQREAVFVSFPAHYILFFLHEENKACRGFFHFHQTLILIYHFIFYFFWCKPLYIFLDFVCLFRNYLQV